MYFKFYNFVFYITMAAYAYFNIYFRDLGLSSFQIGIVNAVPRGLSLVILPFWGLITDYLQQNKKVLFIALSGTLAVIIIFPAAVTFWSLIIMMFLFAVFQNPIQPLSDSLLLDYLGENAGQYGKFRLWGSIGYMLTVSLIGYYLEQTASKNLFTVYAVFIFLSILLLKGLPESRRDIKIFNLGDFTKIFKNKKLFQFLLFVFILQTTMNANYVYFPLYIVDHGGGEFLLGLAMTLSSGSEIFAFFASEKIIDKLKMDRIVFIISLSFTLRWILLFLFPVKAIILTSQLLHSLTFGLFYAVGVNYVSKISGEKFRATGQNIFSAVYLGISSISGSLIGGKLYEIFGGELMYLIWSLTTASAGIFYIFTLSNNRKKLREDYR
ncbi:MAG: MFS transporter [Bacillota bacterium]